MNVNKFPVQVGCFYMQNGSLVRVSAQLESGRFMTEYVHISDTGIGGGGGSGGWPESDYLPITDPMLIAIAMVREAQLQAHDARVLANRADQQISEWTNAMKAIKAAHAVAKGEQQ
ncbi:hypothetical protein [Achromobacter xylosoxidans]|uniref:hypothetical protein n=1 Tax=Alcaligenes xylosoxydans xylosoxydans TaxID=85698 RepID=UPI001F136B2A|nr:hypothetical protein [Achromobacter xylosoxidans]